MLSKKKSDIIYDGTKIRMGLTKAQVRLIVDWRYPDSKTHYPQGETWNYDMDNDEVYVREDIYRQLFEAIDNLPPRQREIFMSVMEGKKNKEIAEALGISVFTVKVQRQRAMHTLRNKLTDKQWLLLMNFLFI